MTGGGTKARTAEAPERRASVVPKNMMKEVERKRCVEKAKKKTRKEEDEKD